MSGLKIRCNGEGVPDGYDLFTMDMSSRDFDTETEPDDLSWEEGRFYFYNRFVLTADPSSRNCTVMILHLLDNLLYYADDSMEYIYCEVWFPRGWCLPFG